MNRHLSGLGGWLILVGVGVCIGPLQILYMLLSVQVPLFFDGTWEALSDPASEYYFPEFANLIIGGIVVNVLLLLTMSWMVFLFFTKKALFPKVYIAFALITPVIITVDSWFVTRLLPEEPMFDPETSRELIRSLVRVVIWVPYMLNSTRVANTFVE